MKVIATNTGFYLSLKQKGDEFELENENLFSSKWMKKVKEAPSTSSTKSKPKKQKEAKEELF
jgi:hypothetical protein